MQRSRIPGTILAILLGLAGLAAVAGGIWLTALGGSIFYVLFGLGYLATAALLLTANPWSLWLFAATLAVNLIWALWETGFDWWRLLPRGDVSVAFGLLLALPWVVRGLRPGAVRTAGWRALGACLLVALGVGAGSMFATPHDLDGRVTMREGDGAAATGVAPVPPGEWHAYGRTSYGQRYSPLGQITPGNVDRLEVAWTYRTGDVRGEDDPNETTYEVTPLKIGDTLYLCTPHAIAIALDAETGQEKWRFDPQVDPPTVQTQHMTCRGLSYVDETAGGASGDCARRVFLPTPDGRLIALGAATGAICPGFGGADGTVDLWQNMPNVQEGSYYSTSPPVIAGNLIVVGGTVNDNFRAHEPSGVIRAFDLDTGDLVWNWDSGNPDETAPLGPDETYTANSPNSWSVSSYDPDLGLIYVPLGNSTPDQLGMNRSEAVETYSDTIVALRAETGEPVWRFQGVHHDLWDMDMPAQPSLVDLDAGGGPVPALVAPTKQGDIYVLDRRTGEPILPVVEEPAPGGAIPEDRTAPTQPTSALTFKPEPLTGASMWGISLFDQLACRIQFHRLRYEGRYTPPSTQGTLVYPGNFGVFNWGGVAVDPVRQISFQMPVYLAFVSTLIPRPDDSTRLVSEPGTAPVGENFGLPYAVQMKPFFSALGLPCQQPPWGYVAAAELTTGRIAYRHVNGTVRDLAPVPLPFEMGVPGIGGPLLTGGGVAFLSGTLDYYVRGYDVETGAEIWRARLPAGGQATPMTYRSEASGRQFLLVVAGGHGSTGTAPGDSIIAYALPQG